MFQVLHIDSLTHQKKVYKILSWGKFSGGAFLFNSIAVVKANFFPQSENRGTDVLLVSNDKAGQSKQK